MPEAGLTRDRLLAILREKRVRPRAYSLDGKDEPMRRVVAQRGDAWTVYYCSEHGAQTDIRTFDSSASAYADLLNRLLADPVSYEPPAVADPDGVTGLPNHLAVAAWLEAHAGERVAVVVLDLDRFMFLNDSFGAEVGDAVLREVGGKLRGAVPEEDFVARSGGDEFLVASADPSRADALVTAARAAVSTVTTPDGVAIEVSAGVVTGPARWELLRDAERALYDEKRAHAVQRGPSH